MNTSTHMVLFRYINIFEMNGGKKEGEDEEEEGGGKRGERGLPAQFLDGLKNEIRPIGLCPRKPQLISSQRKKKLAESVCLCRLSYCVCLFLYYCMHSYQTNQMVNERK